MPPVPASTPPVIRLTDRQEAFCQAMACDVGGAEAARRAGYSAKGAKQRGAFLMNQPEIRVRVQQLRAKRRGDHQTLLDEAAVLVEDIITDAMEKKSCGLALRAVEFRLKLGGVIQDRRIAHHYHQDQRHPDADQEDLDCDPREELDALPRPQPAKAIAPKAKALSAPVVTPVSDLSRALLKPPAAGSLLASTAMTALTPALTPTPAARFRLPVAA
jgi:phage terminase small subunit